MRKSIKAIICAASAAVVCAAPTAATFAGVTANTAITAEAASFVSYSNNEVKFDESQINTTVNSFTRTNLSYGDKKSFTRKDVQLFEKQCVTFEVRTSLPSEDSFKRAIQSMKLHVNFYMDEKKQYYASHDYTVKYSRVINTSTHEKVYLCICEFLSYGTSYEASLENLNSSYNGYALDYSKTNIKVTGNSFDYYKVQAIPSSGEKIYAIFPKKVGNTSVSTIGLENWAKNLCLLANSLKIITDHSEDTIFIMPYSYRPTDYIANPSGAHYAESTNYVWANNGKSNKYAVICLGEGGSNSALELETYFINGKAKNVMNKYLIHEMGHSYSNYTDDDFANDYMYSNVTNEIVTDDNFADVRALTAMNNCTNLKKINIRDDARLFSIASLYDKFYGTGMPSFTFCWDQTLIKKIGFDRLERFYSGSTRRWNSAVNIKFANRLSGSTGLYLYNIPTITNANANQYKNFLMFANGLRGLYGYGTGSDANLREFVKNINKDFKVSGYSSGLDFIRNMAVYFLGNDLRGGK